MQWPVTIVAGVMTLAGYALLANGERIARDAEREFYGPVTPTKSERTRDRALLGRFGGDPVRNRVSGVGLLVFGVVVLIVSLAV